MQWLAQLEVLGAVAFAMLLGGVVGYERELKQRPAGFRTHMLVAGAAALLLGIGQLLLDRDTAPRGLHVQVDPLRLVEAVVAGVSFIGAGTIFGRRGADTVAGITTAASLLIVAVIGVAVGLRYYVLGLAATVLALLVLTVLNRLEKRAARHGPPPADRG
ncbi:MgtC/SapB family protein [Vulcaniibacterium thermophilum]|jgi:putative Mg2+ transporter-C (MgtC) family protein|uniref:Protein MgtC n=1 Tax=Vulcaniibacterium thermophilum TaxID=1169913 RepID=A0A918Z5I9_9GAMM|nr:MgtC/SapB family protein [Vulcaniibacterium thermophilum]GHE36945.1 magnesium transporter [Vulcaniibacterium thermophilum]